MSYDPYIWHVGTNRRGWFVLRSLRKPNAHGMLTVYDETEKGNPKYNKTQEKAQRRADKLNERDGITSWLADEQIDWWNAYLRGEHPDINLKILGVVKEAFQALLAEVTYTREN